MNRFTPPVLVFRLAALCVVGVAAGSSPALAAQTQHHARKHAVRLLRRPMRMPSVIAALHPQEGRPLVPASPFVGDRAPTAFDYRLARNGPVGSVGFQRPTANPWATPQPDRGLAASLHLDRPQPIFGAKLSIPLR